MFKVVYEDNHVIAVFKPAGVLSQGDKSGDASIFDETKKYLKEKYKKLGNVFLGLVHRLDRPVSGVMLFAKTSKGASRLSEQFRNHAIGKIYHAVVSGKPAQNRGVLTNLLGKDSKTHKGAEYADGKKAKLYYEVVASNEKYALLKIMIEGGKFHQIRTQLSLAGLPILGDVKYGGKAWQYDGAIALCANYISFAPPTKYPVVVLSVDLPKEWQEYLSTD